MTQKNNQIYFDLRMYKFLLAAVCSVLKIGWNEIIYLFLYIFSLFITFGAYQVYVLFNI
jgi:hypothetical protein